MVGVGIVGIGFMGMIHYLAAGGLNGGRVTAVCTRDPKKLQGDWTSIQGNFGPKGTRMDLSQVSRHSEFDALLADPAVDLVDLCVPNDEHARLAIRALRAGKHVLVEKPIALTTADADSMTEAAKASGRMLLVAHVLPFFPEFAFARQAAESGRYGAIRAAHFHRVISKPDWSKGIADSDRSGGPAIDLHIHDTHFIGLLCGVPNAVQSAGLLEDGAVVHLATQYLYEGRELVVSSVSGALSQSGRSFTHGFEIYLERATLAFEFASMAGEGRVATPFSVILPGGRVDRPELGSGDPVDAFRREIEAAVLAVESGVPSPALAGELARQALRLCHAEIQSVKSRAKVKVN